MIRLPDFIIIGAMKCATSTLHEQLALQPGFFMSTPKEPCFFSDEDQYARGVDWYAGLFAAARPNDLCGESSTHYTKLPTYPRTIERLRRHLPDHVRFIYIMRHPIERLVSHYIHEWSQRVIDCSIDQALGRHPELISYGQFAMQAEPYLETFGCERVLPVFFDRLSSQPQAEFERVCRFIGYQGQPRWVESLQEQNVSSQRMRASRIRDALVDLPGVRTVRRRMIPRAVREYVKGFWMMKRRPELSAGSVERVRAVFDEDLSRLGGWLGLSGLRCETFKTIARETAATWDMAVPA